MIECIRIYFRNWIKHDSNYAFFSVMLHILGEFYPKVGIYNDGKALYAATNEWHLTECMTTYLNDEETDTDTDGSTPDLG